MKVYRYMSNNEFNMLTAGCTISGANSICSLCNTTSNGVCFIADNTDVDGVDFDALECYDFLNGVVSDDVLVCMEISEDKLNIGYGVYAHPFGGFYDTVTIKEYCIDEYSIDDVTILAYNVDFSGYKNRNKWYEWN